jgi:hypothetical protein
MQDIGDEKEEQRRRQRSGDAVGDEDRQQRRKAGRPAPGAGWATSGWASGARRLLRHRRG